MASTVSQDRVQASSEAAWPMFSCAKQALRSLFAPEPQQSSSQRDSGMMSQHPGYKEELPEAEEEDELQHVLRGGQEASVGITMPKMEKNKPTEETLPQS